MSVGRIRLIDGASVRTYPLDHDDFKFFPVFKHSRV